MRVHELIALADWFAAVCQGLKEAGLDKRPDPRHVLMALSRELESDADFKARFVNGIKRDLEENK